MCTVNSGDYNPYFQQESPQVPILGLIADRDTSPRHELKAIAVFKAKRGYLVVEVSGCSCWPDHGSTTEQTHCVSKVSLQRELSNGNLQLFLKCQERGFKVYR